MKLRWFDEESCTETCFEALNVDDFKDKTIDFLIEFRLKTRKVLGTSYTFPSGVLEIWLPTERWYQVRVDEDQPPYRIPPRGLAITEDGPPDDAKLVKANSTMWWTIASRIVQKTQRLLDKERVAAH